MLLCVCVCERERECVCVCVCVWSSGRNWSEHFLLASGVYSLQVSTWWSTALMVQIAENVNTVELESTAVTRITRINVNLAHPAHSPTVWTQWNITLLSLLLFLLLWTLGEDSTWWGFSAVNPFHNWHALIAEQTDATYNCNGDHDGGTMMHSAVTCQREKEAVQPDGSW